MMIIELKDVELYAYHGIGEEERSTGGRFLVNAKVAFDERNSSFAELSDTINYATLFDIVRQRMALPSALLESVATDIIRQIKQQFNMVNEIECSIYKLQAPIPYLKGKVGITLHKKFND